MTELETIAHAKNYLDKSANGSDLLVDMPVGEHDGLRRFDGRWEAVAKVLPYCNEAEFYDNDNGFLKVGEYRNGELILVGENHPAWILDLNAYLNQQ